MKKVIFAAIMCATAYTLFAQDPPVEKIKIKEDKTKIKYADDTKVKYEGDNMVPLSIRTHFMTAYPDITVVTWHPMDEWWYATYTDDDNRIVRVYYNTQPYYLERDDNFLVALPVLNTYVPEPVITSAINNYGNSLYSITALKTVQNENAFQVTLIRNGVSEMALMDEEGVVVYTNFTKVSTGQ